MERALPEKFMDVHMTLGSPERVANASNFAGVPDEGGGGPTPPSTHSTGRARARTPAAMPPISTVMLAPTPPPAAPSPRSSLSLRPNAAADVQTEVDSLMAVDSASSRVSAAHAVNLFGGGAEIVRASRLLCIITPA